VSLFQPKHKLSSVIHELDSGLEDGSIKHMETSDLLKQIGQGSAAAWSEFIRRYNPTIMGVVRKRLGRSSPPNPSLVDDLVMETYLKLVKNNCAALTSFKFQNPDTFYGYLKVVTSCVVEDYLREHQASVQTRTEGEIDNEPGQF